MVAHVRTVSWCAEVEAIYRRSICLNYLRRDMIDSWSVRSFGGQLEIYPDRSLALISLFIFRLGLVLRLRSKLGLWWIS